MLILIEADVIEDEEFGLGAEVGSVGNAAILQVELGLLGDPARVALVALLGDGILDIAIHDDRRHFGERVHKRGGGIRDEQHVAFMDCRPAADAGAIHAEALFETALIDLVHGIRDVVLQARNIGEPEIELLGTVSFRVFQNFLGSHRFLLFLNFRV